MKALILVDIQNDFCPGGALAVNKGDEVVAVANELMASNKFDLVVATQDWHPADHKSFASNNPGAQVGAVGELNGLPQVWWPDHCINGTKGADFHRNLNMNKVSAVFRKGMASWVDSYSGFYDNKALTYNGLVASRRMTGLGGYLHSLMIARVYVMGLATDYCVKFTALDALSLGFKTSLVVDGCRAVNINPNDSDNALEEMYKQGVQLLSGDLVLSGL